jgi:hypothetical protein
LILWFGVGCKHVYRVRLDDITEPIETFLPAAATRIAHNQA